jgi:hypothetical protein
MITNANRLLSGKLTDKDGSVFNVNVFDRASIDIMIDLSARYAAYNKVSSSKKEFYLSDLVRSELTRTTL